MKRITGILLILLVLLSVKTTNAGRKCIEFKDGKATITIEDHLHHPLYWWPATLLTYDVIFETNTSGKDFVLIDGNTGKHLPFQISSLSGQKATLHIIADLPSGAKRTFILQKGAPDLFMPVDVLKEGKFYKVTTDKFSVSIPASTTSNKDGLPGPFAGFSANDRISMGRSFFHSGVLLPKKLETKLLSHGPLFALFELRYTFDEGVEYIVTLKLIKGYEFIEMGETMKGFPKDQKISLEVVWDNFAPTHRQAPNHPYGNPKKDATGFDRYNWENISQTMLNSHHGIIKSENSDGKIPFELGIFGNWPAELNITSSLFWDEHSNRSVGIFVQNISNWNSYKYPIWKDPQELSIKFFYKDSLLRWSYPLIDGTRTTAVSFYDHQKDIEFMDNLEKLIQPIKNSDGTSYQVKMSQLSYNSFLQNRYSTLWLDQVKDWCLVYPSTLRTPPVIFDNFEKMTLKDFEQDFFYGWFSNELAVSGTCQNSGYGPTSSRLFYDKWTGMMNIHLPEMSPEVRERMIAMYLLHSYIAAGEEYMPMKHMLSGHPNFLSDVKSVLAYTAYLFPEHPDAKNWADLFEKFIDLNNRYHVRPNVSQWDAMGGRWTENSGTYLWAALRPVLRATYLLQHYFDGKNRLPSEQSAMIGAFVLNSLSAPFNGESLEFYHNANGKRDMNSWNLVTQNGPARILPPQGAHSIRRRPPNSYWLLGKELEYFEPLLSENIRYVARPDFDDFETESIEKNSFKFMYPQNSDDSGTPPLLESVKMTGAGIVLRADVGTEKEISIHLGQLDNGPNYRWGIVGEGGGGTIYFYANGKSFSNNGKEDIGDRRLQDTDLATGFGVFKDGRFKAVGKSELDRPLYDLGLAQFAEVTTSKQTQYSWPEYQGRSILLAGSDYFIIYDDVYNQNMGSRFSWFTHVNDTLPEIKLLKGGGADYTYNTQKPEFIIHQSRESKGIWVDGTGDFMTFVSHKKIYTVESTPFGCMVTSPEVQKDYIFRNDEPIQVEQDGFVFSGTAGIIRTNDSGNQQMAIFHGTRIGNAMFEIRPHNPDVGLSATYYSDQRISGRSYSLQPSKVTFVWKTLPEKIAFYIDGIKQTVIQEDNQIEVLLTTGKHIWTFTTGLPDLPRPLIAHTRNIKGKVELSIVPVTGAASYCYEYSVDQGKTWNVYTTTKLIKVTVSPLGSEYKGYMRVTACNKDNNGIPSVIYPLYFTSEKPHYPDGLKLKMSDGTINITWGNTLGCSNYKLYKRKAGEQFKVIYTGNGNKFTDKPEEGIYEYAICSSNGNGQSELSPIVTTDPDSWLNFDPMPGEPFRRTVTPRGTMDNDGNLVNSYYP